jgi:hypothetical protein
VGSAVIVEAQPGLQRSCAMSAGLVDGAVGPFVLQGLDEPFGFSVRLRAARAGAEMLDVMASAGTGPFP